MSSELGRFEYASTLAGIQKALAGLSKPEAWLDLERAIDYCLHARRNGKRFFFIGNGGSAAIASHMAADWLKNGHARAMCFNDGPLVTCVGNDLGFHRVFSMPINEHGEKGDLLFAISSSGQSKSILNAVEAARNVDVRVITLSGFKPDNPLRSLGDVNFYVPSDRYGVVEVAHHAICHSILDAVVNATYIP